MSNKVLSVRGNYDNAVTLLKSVLNLTNSAASAGSSVDNWHPLSFVVHHRLALVHLMTNNFNEYVFDSLSAITVLTLYVVAAS